MSVEEAPPSYDNARGTNLSQIWSRASEFDQTLRFHDGMRSPLQRVMLRPRSYSSRALFDAIARQIPVVFDDAPLRDEIARIIPGPHAALGVLRRVLPAAERTLVKVGPSQRRRWLTIGDVLSGWENDRRRASANDIFYRDLGVARRIGCERFAEFSLLRGSSDHLRELEVATMLIGTTGCVTDSHSDDPDGANHCIAGEKLWFVWDRREGQLAGLEDCEYDSVFTRCRFDLSAFCRLKSAKWFLMTPGRTLFLPGAYTHKVITISKYIGISVFYVCLVNILSSLTRWRVHGATMVSQTQWEEIARLALRRIKASGEGVMADPESDAMALSLRMWRRHFSSREREIVSRDPIFVELHRDLTAQSLKRRADSATGDMATAGWSGLA